MMADERKLNIPIYDVDEEPDTNGVDQGREAPQSQSERRRGKKSGPGPRQQWAQERQAEQQATYEAARAGDPIAALRHQSRQSGHDLMSAVRRSGLARPGTTRGQQRKRITTLQQAYATQMVFHAMRPIQGGLNAASVLETVGMSTMMLMVSPQFRDHLGNQLNQTYNTITNKIARRGEKGVRGREHAMALRGGSREDMSRRDVRRLARYERLDRHGLAPFTAESAALMEVGLAENTYAEMRAPGADPDLVVQRHTSALGLLYSLAGKDGVDPTSISTNMRTIVNARLGAEPRLAQVFPELAHGRFVTDGQGRLHDPSTGKLVDAGSFTPRRPMSAEAHNKALHEVFVRDFDTALGAGDESMEAQMYVFAAGMYTQQYPDAVDAVQNPVLRDRLTTCRSVFGAMADDGLTPHDALETYQKTLISAIETTSATSPEFAERWHGPEGDVWRTRLAERLQEFSEFAQETQTPDAGEQKPEPSNAETDVDMDEQVVDAEVVTSPLPDPGEFVPPKYKDPASPEGDLLEQMSTFMGDDIVGAARVDDSRDRAGNTWMPRSVYSIPLQPHTRDAIHAEDPEALQRELAMVSMRDEMTRLNMAPAQQDAMFAAAYVRGLDKAIQADPAYERVVTQAAASSTGSWREVEFARSIARTGTEQPEGGYAVFAARCGVDPELLEDQFEFQSSGSDAADREGPSDSAGTSGRLGEALDRARDLERKRRQVRLVRGRLNRAYNAADDRKPGTDVDVQFDFTHDR